MKRNEICTIKFSFNLNVFPQYYQYERMKEDYLFNISIVELLKMLIDYIFLIILIISFHYGKEIWFSPGKAIKLISSHVLNDDFCVNGSRG